MNDKAQSQADAATRAAEARAAIAKKISSLVGKVGTAEDAEVVLRLAQAYAALAAEPPRTRGGTVG
jgi:Skp family chaperone for outer membrane proteins